MDKALRPRWRLVQVGNAPLCRNVRVDGEIHAPVEPLIASDRAEFVGLGEREAPGDRQLYTVAHCRLSSSLGRRPKTRSGMIGKDSVRLNHRVVRQPSCLLQSAPLEGWHRGRWLFSSSACTAVADEGVPFVRSFPVGNQLAGANIGLREELSRDAPCSVRQHY